MLLCFFKMEKNRARVREKEEEEGIPCGLMPLEILHLDTQVHKFAIMFTRSKASTDSWL